MKFARSTMPVPVHSGYVNSSNSKWKDETFCVIQYYNINMFKILFRLIKSNAAV